MEYRKLKDIKLLDRNPRTIRDDDFKKLVQSIEANPDYFEARPLILSDRTGELVIIAGNQRYRAAKELKLKEVPTFLIKDLTEEREKEIIIRDNVSNGEWDFDLLANDWDVDQLEDWGLDVPDFGADEILEAEEDDFDEAPPEIPITVLGDLYEIGEHRLLCGDSTDSDAVARLMDGNKAELLFTSPPYNAGSLNIKGNESTQKKYNSFEDNQTEDDFFKFLISNIDSFIPFVDEIFYNIGLVENNKRVINKLVNHYNNIFKDVIYWKKSTVAPHIQPGVINNLVEFIYCFGDGKRKFKNAQFNQGSYWNVIEGKNASGNEFAKIHKATFPIYLPENIINNFSNVNAIVCDSFLGSGTTMVASHQLKRKCYGMELDPKYCDVIVRRMLKLDNALTVKRNGVDCTNEFK